MLPTPEIFNPKWDIQICACLPRKHSHLISSKIVPSTNWYQKTGMLLPKSCQMLGLLPRYSQPPDPDMSCLSKTPWNPNFINEYYLMELPGGSSKIIFRNLKSLVVDHRPDVLILLELEFLVWELVEWLSLGNLIVLFVLKQRVFRWYMVFFKKSCISFEILSINDQYIRATVLPSHSTAIYTSPKEKYRKELWQYIREVISLPWLLLGDFNQVLTNNEKL